jgi:hypothetical protein
VKIVVVVFGEIPGPSLDGTAQRQQFPPHRHGRALRLSALQQPFPQLPLLLRRQLLNGGLDFRDRAHVPKLASKGERFQACSSAGELHAFAQSQVCQVKVG